MSPFDRSGLASLTDLASPEWRSLFEQLEREQAAFRAAESRFRSPEYAWPRDPLHNWSRVWEYPYAFHHVTAFAAGRRLHLADIGSGTTFFPFALARQALRMTCVDVDRVTERDLKRAAEVVPHDPGRVEFRLTDGSRLPFEDGELDGAVCISVLEHVPGYVETIREMARAIRGGGRLVLTMDLDLRGDAQIGVAEHAELMRELSRHFAEAAPDTSIHPADLLTTRNGPYPLPEPPRRLARVKQVARELARRASGRHAAPLFPPTPPYLAVHGLALTRRS